MIEISPILASYPVQKIKKVSRENNKQQPSQKKSSGDNDELSNEQPKQHIDEIV